MKLNGNLARVNGPARRTVATAVLGLAVALIAWSGTDLIRAHGGDETIIHGCARKPDGALRLVSPTEQCVGAETPVDWNVRGPSGVSGYQIVRLASASNVTIEKTVLVTCPAGKVAVSGGGIAVGGAAPKVVLTSMIPASNGSSNNAMAISARNTGPAVNWHLSAWAVCMLAQ